MTISEIKDGTANTVMVIEVDSQKSISWMSPRDVDEQYFLDLDSKSKLTHTGGLHTLMADGSVRFVSCHLNENARHALLTIDAGDTTGDF
ncbi:MAG TPA: H-X9-DG-CTERM domain-containing protein [Schlesneria sp.]|jgi:prepilin-type processing-associated H-X9-DG protein